MNQPEIRNASNIPPQATDEQRKQALDFLQKVIGDRQSQYKPLNKILEEIGIKPHVLAVMIGDEPVECLVIPVQELMMKEYKFMTGFDWAGVSNVE